MRCSLVAARTLSVGARLSVVASKKQLALFFLHGGNSGKQIDSELGLALCCLEGVLVEHMATDSGGLSFAWMCCQELPEWDLDSIDLLHRLWRLRVCSDLRSLLQSLDLFCWQAFAL
jgi:hypothetical protein